ncbi:MAG: hypothetical protein Q8861_12215 [Bacteroidota bacterium]|nr:hypothetical protein [Bacteroidota bacterium]
MKKIVLVLGILVACVASSHAINRFDGGVIKTINNEAVFEHLSAYLNIDEDQAADLKNVMEATQSSLLCAEKSGDAKGYGKALHYNFASAARILTADQYAKYCSIIRLTVKNRYQDRHSF